MTEAALEDRLYRVLEVSPNASFEEIDAAYARIMAYLGEGSLATYAMLDDTDALDEQRDQVEQAYRVLSDPDLRAQYDHERREDSGDYPSIMVPTPAVQRSSQSASTDFYPSSHAPASWDDAPPPAAAQPEPEPDSPPDAPIGHPSEAPRALTEEQVRRRLEAAAAALAELEAEAEARAREERAAAQALAEAGAAVVAAGPLDEDLEVGPEELEPIAESEPITELESAVEVEAAGEVEAGAEVETAAEVERAVEVETAAEVESALEPETTAQVEVVADAELHVDNRAPRQGPPPPPAEVQAEVEEAPDTLHAGERADEPAPAPAAEESWEVAPLSAAARHAQRPASSDEPERITALDAAPQPGEADELAVVQPAQAPLPGPPRLEPRRPPRSPGDTVGESTVSARPPVVRPRILGQRFDPMMEIPEILESTELSGVLLRKVRESASATLDEVAKVTKISKRYLRAIEDDDYKALPAEVYIRGFVREYAKVLGLPGHVWVQAYMRLYERYRGERDG